MKSAAQEHAAYFGPQRIPLDCFFLSISCVLSCFSQPKSAHFASICGDLMVKACKLFPLSV